jgi:hypothetical protein
MKYLVPFSVLKNSIRLQSVKGQLKVDMNYDELLDMLKRMLQAVTLDDAWYRRTYPDVDEAIKAGTYRDAKQHFVENGYFEGRKPFEMGLNEEWYLTNYPDVKKGIEEGTLTTARDHYDQHGYDEGRLPMPF